MLQVLSPTPSSQYHDGPPAHSTALHQVAHSPLTTGGGDGDGDGSTTTGVPSV